MFHPKTILNTIIFLLTTALLFSGHLAASDKDFSEHYSQIYQIRVVSPAAGSKSSIGSGFQISADGLIMTNYHVISDYVNSPDAFEIQYYDHNGDTGTLELIDFDVINDLAVLKHPDPADSYLMFSSESSVKGESLYALGNPHDWGVVMVPGPNNGLVEHSFKEQILFSGSLNGGMSGGPTLNDIGEVVGVNVATAGSQLSFLVPAKHAIDLVGSKKQISPGNYEAEIAKQISQWQQTRIGQLLGLPWETKEFDGKELIAELRKDFRCWGETNEDDKQRKYNESTRYCYTSDDLYISAT